MITIDQLLESVDLAFEPRYITKNESGEIRIWKHKPYAVPIDALGRWNGDWSNTGIKFGKLKLSEFDGKDWKECIYEVPRKVNYGKLVGKLCRFYDKTTDRRTYGLLAYRANGVFAVCGINSTFDYCEPVRPDDDVIYKGE